MSTIQFKSSAVLFSKAEAVSFCAADCTCTEPPPPPSTCPDCQSRIACYQMQCTPQSVSVSFTGVTIPSSVTCTTSGGTVALTGGPLVGPYTLPQDPTNPCRWLLDDPNSAFTATGPGGLTTTRLRVMVQRVDDGFVCIVSMIFPVYVEFVIFGGGITTITEFPDTGSFTVPGNTDAAYCLSCTFGGGKLGTGGTATVTLCPAPTPPACTLTDGGCYLVSGLPDLTVCTLFTPYSGDGDDPFASARSILLLNSSSGVWDHASQNIAATTDAVFAINYQDGTDPTAAPYGCGYYLTLTGSSLAGTYYLRSTTPAGVYALKDAYCDGLPATLTVTANDCPPPPAACGGPSAVQLVNVPEIDGQGNPWTSSNTCSASVSAWDGSICQINTCNSSACTFGSGFVSYLGRLFGLSVSLSTGPNGSPAWVITFVETCSTDDLPTRWVGYKYTGSTPVGDYASDPAKPLLYPPTITIA